MEFTADRMNKPSPNRQKLYSHPEPVDIQRILHNAVQLHKDISLQLQGHMPFGIALSLDDQLHFVGYTGGAIDHGLIESVAQQLKEQRPHLKACARCTRVEIKLQNGQRLTALQVFIEHRSGPPLCVYHPIDQPTQWWVEAGEAKIFPANTR